MKTPYRFYRLIGEHEKKEQPIAPVTDDKVWEDLGEFYNADPDKEKHRHISVFDATKTKDAYKAGDIVCQDGYLSESALEKTKDIIAKVQSGKYKNKIAESDFFESFNTLKIQKERDMKLLGDLKRAVNEFETVYENESFNGTIPYDKAVACFEKFNACITRWESSFHDQIVFLTTKPLNRFCLSDMQKFQMYVIAWVLAYKINIDNSNDAVDDKVSKNLKKWLDKIDESLIPKAVKEEEWDLLEKILKQLKHHNKDSDAGQLYGIIARLDPKKGGDLHISCDKDGSISLKTSITSHVGLIGPSETI